MAVSFICYFEEYCRLFLTSEPRSGASSEPQGFICICEIAEFGLKYMQILKMGRVGFLPRVLLFFGLMIAFQLLNNRSRIDKPDWGSSRTFILLLVFNHEGKGGREAN